MKIYLQKNLNTSLVMAAALLILAACQASEPPASASKTTAESTVSQPALKQASADKVELKKNTVVAAEAVAAKAVPHDVATQVKSAVVEKKMPVAVPLVEAKRAEVKKAAAATVKARATSTAKISKTMQNTKTTPKSVAEKAATVKVVSFPAGDVAKGKLLARKCAACHNFNSKKKIGPGLAGIFGREAGTAPGFKYKFTKYIQPGKAWRWDAAHLAAWDCDAKAAVKTFTGNPAAKTKMGVQHVCDAAKQADLIAFLKTL